MQQESTEFADPEQPVDTLIAAILAAMDAGQRIDPREWIGRYPKLAPELEEFFADLGIIEGRFKGTDPPDSTLLLENTGHGRFLEAPVTAFGRYTLLKRIGEGGQGEVWKALQSRPSRLVAIKIVKGGYLASAEEVRRFRDEAETISRLDHPHIIPVYEVGENDHHHYFSMKLIAGGSLINRLSIYQDRPEEAADLMIQVAKAVQHAHEHGVIHRDLKPSNILCHAVGDSYLTDFGLAKRFGEDVEATQSGSIQGTAPYMAPEQASGKKGVVTTSSDVYGLGATLYALLTGRAPFGGNSLLETLDLVRECQPVSPLKINPKVPRDLATICLKCMEKTPARRYQTALQVAEDLGNWRQKRPIKARPVGPRERLSLWCLRRPGLAAAVAAVILVAALGIAGVVWQLRQTLRSLAREARTRYFNSIALAEQAWSDHNFGRASELLAKCPAGQRGWEWFYLMGQRRRGSFVIKDGHKGKVYSVAFSRDGRYLVSAGIDGLVKVWDAANGHPVRTLEGHKKAARCVVFRGREFSSQVASASWDGTVIIWDIETGRQIRTLQHTLQQEGKVISVSCSRGGQYLASADELGSVKIWNLATGQLLRTIAAHNNTIFSVSYCPDGDHLATAGDDGVVKLWNAITGRQIWTTSENIESVRCLAFNPDGSHLALACGDGTVRVLDSQTGRIVVTSDGRHTDAVRGVAYGSEGTRIASAGGDGTVKLWAVSPEGEAMQEAITLRVGPNVVVRCVAFSSGSNPGRLAAADDNGNISVWEAPSGTSPWDALRVLPDHRGVIHGVAYSPDDRLIATACGDQWIRILTADTGDLVHTLKGHTGPVYAVAYSPDGHYLASGGADKIIRVWNTATGRLDRSLPEHTYDVWCLAFSRDGRFLASADGNGMVNLLDLTSRRGETLRTKGESVWCLALSRDSQLIATGDGAGLVQVYNVGIDRSAARFPWEVKHENVTGVSFSRDGSRLASSGDDGLIKLWNTETHTLVRTYSGSDRTDGVAFSPDGEFLVAASWDGTVKVWDATRDDPNPLLLLCGHTSRVRCLAFSPNGQRLVSAGFDRTARIWDTSKWAEARNALAVAQGR